MICKKMPALLLFLIALAWIVLPVKAAGIAVPEGFEELFNTRQQGIFDILYGDSSLGTLSAEYDRQQVILHSPGILVSQITAAEMPPLKITAAELLTALSAPLERVGLQGTADEKIVVRLNESDSSLRLVFPGHLFNTQYVAKKNAYISHLSTPGFVHGHNLNYLTDSYGDSYNISAIETLNISGNIYLKTAWSYASTLNFHLEEMALYLEHENIRFQAGRQRMSDNLNNSTPSVTYSFFNPTTFDGISLGYISDNYISKGSGAATPVAIYLSQSGTVEVYRNGRLIDLQHFSAGLQHLDTRSWPAGGYNVLLVTKLVNGATEETTHSFFKRTGSFRSGDIEYITQLGRYSSREGNRVRVTKPDCQDCSSDIAYKPFDNLSFANVAAAWTTGSALTLGGGVLFDNRWLYGTSNIDIPVNSWLTERIYADGLFGSTALGYQFGTMKNFSSLSLNGSYRRYYFKGDKQDYRRYGLIPAYDFETLQFGTTTFLPWNTSLGLNYGMNTFYQTHGRQDKTQFKNWDITLNRDFTLSNQLTLRVDLGYHHGLNTFINSQNYANTSENRLYAQFSLGVRERSHSHHQALFLRSRVTDTGDENVYGANYMLNLDNPEFDRGSKYALNISADRGPDNTSSTGAGVVVDNHFGYTTLGFSSAFGGTRYSQKYLSQRSGFAVGEGDIAWGKVESNAVLIVDALTLPEDHYYEVRNRNYDPVILKGGQSTTLNISPYQKVAPHAEQLFTTDLSAFYNLNTHNQSTRAMPGQVYRVKLTATQNLTVTGRLRYKGQPLANARVVGANAISDEEGLFVGDYSLENQSRLTSLTIKKDGQTYLCPLVEQKIKMTQGIMQIREVNCETE